MNENIVSIEKSGRNQTAHLLTARAIRAQNIDVRGIHEQTAKFRDSHSLPRRQHRHNLHGGFFSSVECVNGFMPGIRRLQEEEIPNKRMVFLESHESTRQILPNLKTQLGAVTMTAIKPMGSPARNASAHLTVGGAA